MFILLRLLFGTFLPLFTDRTAEHRQEVGRHAAQGHRSEQNLSRPGPGAHALPGELQGIPLILTL